MLLDGLRREARLLGALEHANIVTFYGLSLQGGQPKWLVMERGVYVFGTA